MTSAELETPSPWTRRTFLGAGAAGTLGALTAPAASAATRRHPVVGGAYVPDPFWDPAGWREALAAYSARVGRRPSLVHWFVQWGDHSPFPARTVASVRRYGSTPLITWEPWNWSAGPWQSPYRLSRITAGAHDDYIRRFAWHAKAYRYPVYLRFAPEMNGDWNPWSEKVNHNRRGDYVRAWRHVHTLFRRMGARNVRWVWTPIVNHWHSTPLRQVFPGNAYVDVVGLDGYNWGSTKPYLGWRSFGQIFNPSIRDVRQLSSRPLWITEVGSTEEGGDKAAWVRDMFRSVQRDTRISGLVWFNADKETDWRVNSSPEAMAAFRQGMSSSLFR
ncbi:MAG: glycoside hydrolase family 26 protein [Angustibacter sp.]